MSNLSAVEAKLKRDLQQQTDDLLAVLNTHEGKRVLLRLIEHAHLDQVSYGAGSASDTAFLEGQRNEGLFLKSLIISTKPEAWLELQQMQFNKIKEQDEEHDRNSSDTSASSRSNYSGSE